MGIVDRPGRIVEGEIQFRRWAVHGRAEAERVVDLAKLALDGEDIRAIRGAEIALVFQEPMSSFSPVHTIGDQTSEVIVLHQRLDRRQACEKTIVAGKCDRQAPSLRLVSDRHAVSCFLYEER